MPNNNTANSSYVSAAEPAVAGAIYRAPIGTALPTSALTELNEAFATLGYISEDGYTNSNTRSSDTTKDWSGADVLSLMNEKTDTFKYKMLESLRVEVLKEVFGDDNVSGTLDTELVVKANAKELTEHSYVIDVLLKGGYIRRTVIPKAKVTEVAEVAYKKTEALGYEVTITAYPDTSENTHYEYTAKPAD